MTETMESLDNTYREAQNYLKETIKELELINRALERSGHNPVLEYSLQDLTKVYMLHEHIFNNGFYVPKENQNE